MAASNGIKEVIEEIEKLQAAGQQDVSVNALITYLKKVDQTTISEGDLLRLQHESNLAHYTAKNNHNLEMLRSVFETSRGALKTSILVNGGACVALISLMSKEKALTEITKLWFTYGLSSFGLGVLMGAIATGTAYVTQYNYWKKHNTIGLMFHCLTVFLIVLTYLLFGYGVLASYHALVS